MGGRHHNITPQEREERQEEGMEGVDDAQNVGMGRRRMRKNT